MAETEEDYQSQSWDPDIAKHSEMVEKLEETVWCSISWSLVNDYRCRR